ncbi:DNA-processing protein DprA [Nesterenkonia natronophila]|uniref:DNA-processing protein DprA n=1 Tax=Nesterenkonia natronophila TaxID=2174932 RepID=A0A3A4FYG1_9MICC|nr:DNA-processing protein DprA [Nesterenkonia natronophila]RJN31089.1 DNA-processing protein DprA [Nesterenkonia natronophila]
MCDTSGWAATSTRHARAGLSRLIEPGDLLGPLTVEVLGAEQTLELIASGTGPTPQEQQRVGEAAEASGLTARQRRLPAALQRWRTRLPQIRDTQMLRSLYRCGGGLLIPEDAAWPRQLNDLGPAQPLALWFRVAAGDSDPYSLAPARLPQAGRSVAVVGSREMTDYGGKVAWETARELAAHGVSIISGGAYGIDAAAHRGSLDGAQEDGWPALAVLAGGVDRFYPAGNDRLLHAILDRGIILSEMPPGSAPTRHRFLQRNRLIAALAAGTVVVEARWRSGALSTAHHAMDIGRPVGAVPGSVYSASSAGCHRLLRHTPAQLITDAADIMELVAADGADPGWPPGLRPAASAAVTGDAESRSATDGLGEVDRRIFEALPVRSTTTPSRLSEAAGLPMPQVLGGLTRLERKRLVHRTGGRWGRTGHQLGRT